VAEKTVEGARNAKDGKVTGSGCPVAQRTPLVDVAKRGKPTPRKVLDAGRRWAGTERQDSEGE